MSSLQPDGTPGPPQLVTVANPPSGAQIVELLTTTPGHTTQLESLYVDFIPGPEGFTEDNNACIRIEWLDPTGEVIYSHTTYAPNVD
jgi:hypothetical protein